MAMQINVGQLLSRRARLQPESVGLYCGAETLTYAVLDAQVKRVAAALGRLGVQPGDRAGLLLANSPEFLICFFALARIGAVVVPLNWRLAPPELAYITDRAGISSLIYGGEYAATVAALAPQTTARLFITTGVAAAEGHLAYADLPAEPATAAPGPARGGDDPAVIMFTSGTTGRPRGAVLTHNNLYFGAATVAWSLDWRREDRVIVALPLFHIGALIYVLINVCTGAGTVLMPAFTPDGFLRAIERHRATSFLAVPAMLSFMLQLPDFADYDLSSVRWALCGTAPVPVPLIEAWARRGIAIQQVYGLTESSGGAAVLGAEQALAKVGSTGRAMFHTELRVVSAAGRDAASGEVGEILIAGPTVMAGYWDDAAATAEAIRDGWLYTGDLGRLDAEGYLYIVDRKKDMIISGGENIYPAEVENVLAELPQIAEAAVIGIPHPDWGEVAGVVARLKEGQSLTMAEVVAHCQGRLARYKIPRQLVITDRPLPRSPAGKVLKRLLKT